jgi:phosphonate transport system substrate-binding protein
MRGVTRTIAVLLLLAIAATMACERKDDTPKVSLEDRAPSASTTDRTKRVHLRVAIGGMITPREGFTYYRKFLDYLGDKLGRPVDLVDREGYKEINNLVKSGAVDVAFVCGGPYVDGHDAFGMELIAAPMAYGKTVYYSYIIVPKDSTTRSLAGLRGKTFAFTDPLSNSGTIVPTYLLARMGKTPQSFFKRTIYTRAHDRSIRAVAEGMVDGAAVDSLIWEYLNRTTPEDTSRTRIIQRSPPYGIPPVVASPRLDAKTKDQVRQILLNADRDERGRNILQGMMIDRFVPIEDGAYDSIREMKQWIAQQKGGK